MLSVATNANLPHVPGYIIPLTVLILSDSIAKHIVDLTAFVSNDTSTIMAGQQVTLGEIAALDDAAQQYALLGSFEMSMQAEADYLQQLASTNAIYNALASACIALEYTTHGLAVYLAKHSIDVDTHFLAAFNYVMDTTGIGATLPSLLSSTHSLTY
jgi:hypothetical protein